MTTFIDSSVWIDYFNGRSTPQVDELYSAIEQKRAVLGDLVLFEVLQGFREKVHHDSAKRQLLRLPLVRVLDGHLALIAAEYYRALRRRGVTIRKTNDTLIATRCIESGYLLLHSDRDFVPFVEHFGLKLALEEPPLH